MVSSDLGILLQRVSEQLYLPSMKRMLLFALVFAGVTDAFVLAQNCQTATSVPSGHKRLSDGTATVHYDATSRVKGGQSVYVKIKNENALGVSYEVTISEDATPEVPNCTYKAVLLPKTSAIFWGAVFAAPPIAWKVTVAVGSESGAGVLTYEIYSKPK